MLVIGRPGVWRAGVLGRGVGFGVRGLGAAVAGEGRGVISDPESWMSAGNRAGVRTTDVTVRTGIVTGMVRTAGVATPRTTGVVVTTGVATLRTTGVATRTVVDWAGVTTRTGVSTGVARTEVARTEVGIGVGNRVSVTRKGLLYTLPDPSVSLTVCTSVGTKVSVSTYGSSTVVSVSTMIGSASTVSCRTTAGVTNRAPVLLCKGVVGMVVRTGVERIEDDTGAV